MLLEPDVVAVQRRRVVAPPLPDPGVAVGGTDVGLAGDLVVDDVHALHLAKGDPPVRTCLTHHHLEVGEGVVDAVMAGERQAGERFLKDRSDRHVRQAGFHAPPAVPTLQRQADIQPPHERTEKVLPQHDVVGVRPRLRSSPHDLPDASEQPQRRVVTVLCQREDEPAVEVVVHVPPGVPTLPLRKVASQDVHWVGFPVVDSTVDLELHRVDVSAEQCGQRNRIHSGNVEQKRSPAEAEGSILAQLVDHASHRHLPAHPSGDGQGG